MKDEMTVAITYRDKDLNPTASKRYSLEAYTAMLKLDILRIITDVEDTLYETQGNKQKQDWDEYILKSFYRIRHKLLDQANAIERLPENLQEEDAAHDV